MTALQGKNFLISNILRRKCFGEFKQIVSRNKFTCSTFHSSPKFKFTASRFLIRTRHILSASLLSTCVVYYFYTKHQKRTKLETESWTDWKKILQTVCDRGLFVKAECDGGSRRTQFNFIADIVEQAQPAVVFIEVVKGRGFGHVHSSGSGFIVRPDGLILTNAHVVAGASRVQVYLNDGEKVQGVVQAVDQVYDLATVKVQRSNLPTLALGRSSEVRPGEWVVALGSPFNLQKTVTAGIVSNPGRETMGNLTKSPPMIQHDAVINVGNSGGPLINLDGEAIGINTMTLTSGISFALPSDMAVDFLNRAKRVEGKFSQPPAKRRYVGVSVMTLTPDLLANLRRRSTNFPSNIEQGIVIASVISGSPAHQMGLLPRDVITHINGKVVTSTSDFFKAVEVGDRLTLQIARGTGTFSVSVVPEEVD
uniref:Serine protease HTRA2, mitochondrial-like n=1 Tax=Crassostrea virginica TaxID=6565 RepID=A0A8B8EEL5_CRAVI|nr:serine protease HTRA2, mitochondrial-like [Crassostrea virginica]